MCSVGKCGSIVAVVLLLSVSTSAQEVVLNVAEDTVTEGMSVEVCLELFSRDLITGSASVTLVTDDSQVDLNVNAGTDYVPLREEFMFTSMSASSNCVLLQTLRDNAVEDIEVVNLMLVNNSGIEILGTSMHVTILPADDRIVVDFQESSYTFTEGESNLDLCVRLVEGSIERAFPSSIEVDLNTVDITTVDLEDYIDPSGISFSTGSSVGSVQCVLLRLRDDLRVEAEERFQVEIVRNSSTQPVTTNNGLTTITILDDDVASVDLLTASTILQEGNIGERNRVNVCVQLVIDQSTPLDRNVMVLLNTKDVTATENSDYTLQDLLLTFEPGSTSSAMLCTVVYVEGDAVEEGNETVLLQLAPVSPDITFGGVEKQLTITILNDDVNCDALSLEPSSPLSVATPEGLIEGATAIYSCSSGYVLEGDPERVCLGGVWNGSKPTCTGVDCGTPHLLENGNVNFDNTTLNNTATYFCVEGYRQNGDTAQIQCQTDGTWSQRDIECVSEGSTSGTEGLAGGGIAAIVVIVLLVVVGTVLVVCFLIGVWYHLYYRKGKGKYAVDNTDMPTNDAGKQEGTEEYVAMQPVSFSSTEVAGAGKPMRVVDEEEEVMGPILSPPIDV